MGHCCCRLHFLPLRCLDQTVKAVSSAGSRLVSAPRIPWCMCGCAHVCVCVCLVEGGSIWALYSHVSSRQSWRRECKAVHDYAESKQACLSHCLFLFSKSLQGHYITYYRCCALCLHLFFCLPFTVCSLSDYMPRTIYENYDELFSFLFYKCCNCSFVYVHYVWICSGQKGQTKKQMVIRISSWSQWNWSDYMETDSLRYLLEIPYYKKPRLCSRRYSAEMIRWLT